MTSTRTTAAATAARYILGALAVLAVLLAAQTEKTPYALPACQTVDADATDDASLARLLADGWHGDPADSDETLYSPSC